MRKFSSDEVDLCNFNHLSLNIDLQEIQLANQYQNVLSQVKANVKISMIEFNQAATEDHVINSVFTTSEVMLSSQLYRSSDDSSELLS